MKSRKLIIVGDSAFAEIAHEYFDVDTNYLVVAFAVERSFLKKREMRGLPIVAFEDLEANFHPNDHDIFVAVTYSELNRLRIRLTSSAKARGYKLASYISPHAFIWRNVEIGEHCFIFENNTVQPFVKIDSNVVIWSGNHIGHHSHIRANCFISSHVVISGFCDVGENSFIGVNVALANNVTLGKDNWIGPGVAVMKKTPPGFLFRGEQPVPSRVSTLNFFKIKDH